MEVKHRGTPNAPESTADNVANVEPTEIENASTLVIIAFSDACPEETKDWLQTMFSKPGKMYLFVVGIIEWH